MPVRVDIQPITRPISSSEEDIGQYEEHMTQRTDQEVREIVGYDLRFTRFLGWLALASMTLITGAVTWSTATLIELKTQVAVLVARPEGVSLLQYERDSKHWDDEIDALKRRHEREDK